MQVKILKCSDSMYWYSKYIGEVFKVSRVTPNEYWTRERNMYQALNFISKGDCEVVLEEPSEGSLILGTYHG